MASTFSNTNIAAMIAPVPVRAAAPINKSTSSKRKRDEECDFISRPMPGNWVPEEPVVSREPDVAEYSYTIPDTTHDSSRPNSLASSRTLRASHAVQTNEVMTPPARKVKATILRVDSAIALDRKSDQNGSRKRRKVELEPETPHTPSVSNTTSPQPAKKSSKKCVCRKVRKQTDVIGSHEDALYRERAANNIFTRAAQGRAFDAAGPGQSKLRAQLDALRQEIEAVKARESAALTKVERLKQDKLEAERQQQRITEKHSAEVAAVKKANANLEYTAQLNKDEAEKRKKDAEAAERRLKQAEADRKTEVEKLNQKLAESENLRQNAATQHAAELAQLKQQAIAEHSGVVSSLQQQLFHITQERDEVGQRAVAENAQLRLLRTLPNFWSLIRHAEVLNCPVKSRLEQIPSSVPAQSSSPMADFQCQVSEPEAMEGVEKVSEIRDGNGTAVPQNAGKENLDSRSNAILGQNQQIQNGRSPASLATPTGSSSQIQLTSSSRGNDRCHANGYLAPDRSMEAFYNGFVRIQSSGFFSNSSRGDAIADQTRGVKHNARTNPQSNIPCKFFFEKGKCRFEDCCNFSHMKQGPVKQPISAPLTGSRTEQPSQGPPLASKCPPLEQSSRSSTAPPEQPQKQRVKNCYDLLEAYCDSLIEKDKPEILQPQFAQKLKQLVNDCFQKADDVTEETECRLQTLFQQMRNWAKDIDGVPKAIAEQIRQIDALRDGIKQFLQDEEEGKKAPKPEKIGFGTCWTSLPDLLDTMVKANNPMNPKWTPALKKALEACFSSKTPPTCEDLCLLEIARPDALRWALSTKLPKELSVQILKVGDVTKHIKAILGDV